MRLRCASFQSAYDSLDRGLGQGFQWLSGAKPFYDREFLGDCELLYDFVKILVVGGSIGKILADYIVMTLARRILVYQQFPIASVLGVDHLERELSLMDGPHNA